MEEEEINVCFETAMKFVKDAGKVLLTATNIRTKEKSKGDLVSQYDEEIEKILIQQLKTQFPTHKFIGEEESARKKRISELSNEPTWLIDPIDGTANFVRGIPITCISVALVVNKKSVIGIIYNPFLDEMYTAIKGRNAYLNKDKIFTTNTEDIAKANFIYELSLATYESLRNKYITRLNHIIKEIQGIRSFGCAALSLCYVARGYSDCYQCDGLFPWDYAAGALILEEAGGYVCDPTGTDFDLIKGDILACATEKLAKKFVEIERKADQEWMVNS